VPEVADGKIAGNNFLRIPERRHLTKSVMPPMIRGCLSVYHSVHRMLLMIGMLTQSVWLIL